MGARGGLALGGREQVPADGRALALDRGGGLGEALALDAQRSELCGRLGRPPRPRDGEQDGRIRTRAEALEGKSFADDAFSIRPVASASERVEEGDRQHNCLATYVEAVAEGVTDVWLMRRASDPDRSSSASSSGTSHTPSHLRIYVLYYTTHHYEPQVTFYKLDKEKSPYGQVGHRKVLSGSAS